MFEINSKCKEMIDSLNDLPEVKFNQLEKLKTFGKDELSHMKEHQLIAYLSLDSILYIQKHLHHMDDYLPAYRWLLRGLGLDLAVKKVQTDKEIHLNRKRRNR